MINFSERTERLPSGIILASLIVIVLAVAFDLLVPQPSAAILNTSRNNQLKQVRHEIATAKTQSELIREQILPRVWSEGADTVSATVLSQLTTTALNDEVAISAFRPQRTTVLDGITELPFTVQVTGAYPGIHSLMKSLDTPETKVVLRSVQLSASQANSNGVNATIGLTAFLATDPTILPARAREAKNE